MVDALILNYNDFETTEECAIRLSNHSTNDSLVHLNTIKSNKIIVISTDKNGGYGYGNNYGIRYLKENFRSQYILLCNPDTVIENQSITELKFFLKTHSDFAIAAPIMLDKNKIKQSGSAFRIISLTKYILSQSFAYMILAEKTIYRNIVNESSHFVEVDCVMGSLYMMNVDKMIKYGMYDENLFLYGEELVLGMKLKKNKQKTALMPNISYIHDHSVSINKTYKSSLKKHLILVKSHLYIIRNYYNANSFLLFFAKLMCIFSFFELIGINVCKKIKNHLDNAI